MENKGFDRDLAVKMHEFLWFGTFYPDEPCYSLCLKQDSFAWGIPFFLSGRTLLFLWFGTFYPDEPCYSLCLKQEVVALAHFIRIHLVIPYV